MLIKICGLRDAEAVRAAEGSGADLLGFIFVKTRRRYIEPGAAAKLIADNVHRAKTVGVFIDEGIETVNAVAEQCGLDYVQLHGGESAEYARLVERSVIRAVRVAEGIDTDAINHYPCEFVLLDSGAGSGAPFRWRDYADAVRRISKPVLVAGGISAANVAEMAGVLRPAGVDVSGSLEVCGAKSPALIREFLDVARGISS